MAGAVARRSFLRISRVGQERDGGALFGIEVFIGGSSTDSQGRKVEAVMELARRRTALENTRMATHHRIHPKLRIDPRRFRHSRRMELDVTQITIVTPAPRTQLWNELDTQYGISRKIYRNTTRNIWSESPQLQAGVWSRYSK